MSKIVILFLIFIMVLGIFGRLRFPKVTNPFKRKSIKPSVKCKACGRYNLASEKCTCEADG